MTFVWLAVGIVFLFGLLQWARSGAVLWDILSLPKPGAVNTAGADASETVRKKEALQKSVRSMERTMDELLRSSLRVLGVLALCVWLFVLTAVVVDALNLDWLDRLSFTANRIWGNPTERAGAGGNRGSSGRDNMLRSIGSGVR